MDNLKLLDELRAQLAAKRKELEEQEHAISVLEKMMAQSNASSPSPHPVRIQRTVRPTLSRSPESHGGGDKIGQKDLVKAAIEKMNGREFTVTMIEDALQELGMANRFEGGKPRNRISVLLSQLDEENFVTMTFKGGGNVPNRFQRSV